MKSILKLPFFLLTLFLFSCDEILECVFNIEPEIHAKQLAVGSVGSNYYELITSEVNNEANDNDYNYYFTIYGDIPPGIYFDITYRDIEFFGIPEQSGTYRFDVKLEVELDTYDDYDGSPTCHDSVTETFFITIED